MTKKINSAKELFIGAGIGTTAALLLFAVVSVASAALNFNGSTMSGDGAVTIDGPSTISIGNSTATGVTIGQSAHTVTFPGTITATQVNISGLKNDISQAASFDTNEWISVSTASPTNFGSSNFGISLWFNPGVADGGQYTIISNYKTGAYGFTVYAIQNGPDSQHTDLNIGINTGSGLTTIDPNVSLAINAWHHLVITRNGNNLYTYVNGSLVNTTDVTGQTLNASTGGLLIGTDGQFDNFYGSIEEVQIYHAYIGGQVSELYNGDAGFYGIPSDLSSSAVSGYHLDGDATDFVGSNNGTDVNGDPTYITGKLMKGTHSVTDNLTISGGDIVPSEGIRLGSGATTTTIESSDDLMPGVGMALPSIIGSGVSPTGDSDAINFPFPSGDGASISIFDKSGNQPDIRFFALGDADYADIAWMHSRGMVMQSTERITMLPSGQDFGGWTFNVGAGGGDQDNSLDAGTYAIKNISNITINPGVARSGHMVCYRSDGTLGYCTTAPTSGVCTCSAN